MALIAIEGMEFFAYHGCFKEEQMVGNKFVVDFFYESDTKKAENSDRIEETVDYQEIYKIIEKEMMVVSHLIEHVARRTLTAIREAFPKIEYAEITLYKMSPSLGGVVKNVNVTLSYGDE